MDPKSVFPASAGASEGVDLYHAIGGMDVCRELSAAFYAHVEHDPVLRPLYPPTLKGCPIETLAAFFIQFFGGPNEYAQRRWSLSLREAHLRFAIGQEEREAWLTNMFQAVDEVKIKEPMRSALRWFFAQSSAFFINQPSEAVKESPSLLESDIGYQNELETSRIHQDIARRWQAQLMLEEMIAAVRQGKADAVLELLKSLVVQASFTSDRSVFLSFLVILSSSSQPTLLDYVCQTLVSNPLLVQERYTYDRTLLHEVAEIEMRDKLGDTPLHRAVKCGKTNMVAFLLSRGADVHAIGKRGMTPFQVARGASMKQLLQSSSG